jgi:hypothetical protein
MHLTSPDTDNRVFLQVADIHARFCLQTLILHCVISVAHVCWGAVSVHILRYWPLAQDQNSSTAQF